ncbi:hypothetical protein CC86DRAFT_303067 [Ophiobolus disseminans]|uniref:Uncharacterized protein n=1 Tax=Ophiobolus disseminans TaxID=1469910 RepID=A0A6A6ZMM1_9PLEO|nr:hypothetical protein CC86DRAFT_303067 [Ophiobolus disseminans]
MARTYLRLMLAVAGLFARLDARCLNQVAALYPNERTIAADIAVLVFEAPAAAVQDAINEGYPALPEKPKLLPLPSSLNVPRDKHLVIVTTGINNDIRQKTLVDLMIDGSLRQSSVIVPYTTTGRSSTPLSAPLVAYIAGADPSKNPALAGAIPALVATATGGLLSLIGVFIPQNLPYQLDGTGTDGRQLYSSGTKWSLIPNPVSGPGVVPQAFDVNFSPEAAPKYPLLELKKMLNFPYILNAPYNLVPLVGIQQCQRNTYFTNFDTAQVQNISGRVTFGSAGEGPGVILDGTLQKASPNGIYTGAHGFLACTQLVGYSPAIGEGCETAARNVDPNSLL